MACTTCCKCGKYFASITRRSYGTLKSHIHGCQAKDAGEARLPAYMKEELITRLTHMCANDAFPFRVSVKTGFRGVCQYFLNEG